MIKQAISNLVITVDNFCQVSLFRQLLWSVDGCFLTQNTFCNICIRGVHAFLYVLLYEARISHLSIFARVFLSHISHLLQISQ